MRESDKTHDTHKQPRHFSRRGQVILAVLLVVILLVAGVLYSQRHQLHQLARSLTVPPPQAVQITPLTLPSGAATPGQVTDADGPRTTITMPVPGL